MRGVCVCVMGKRQIDATGEKNKPFTLLPSVLPISYILADTYELLERTGFVFFQVIKSRFTFLP